MVLSAIWKITINNEVEVGAVFHINTWLKMQFMMFHEVSWEE